MSQQLKSYRECVLNETKGIHDPTPIPRNMLRDMVKATANTMKPKYMPGETQVESWQFPNSALIRLELTMG